MFQAWQVQHSYNTEDLLYKVLFDKYYRPQVYNHVMNEYKQPKDQEANPLQTEAKLLLT